MYKYFPESLIFSSLILASSYTFADENTLDTIIVTANRHAQPINSSMASVTTISRQQINNSTATDLPSLLSLVAGFDLKPSGPYGKSTSLFLRGTSSSHLLTLIDGVKIYSATSGGTAFQHIPLDQIERIEIVRGPRSSLYGSEAIGGVIQIFTRKDYKQSHTLISAGYGSNNSKELTANISGSTGKSNFSLNARHYTSDGIDVIRHISNNDKDGYINNSINAQLSYQFSEALSLQSSFMNAQGNSEYDNCYNSIYETSDNCNADFVQQVFSNTFKFTPDGIWDGQLQIGSSRDFNDNFWESTANNTYNTQRTDASFINNIQLSEEQLVILGIDYADDKVDATPYTASAAPSRKNTGIFSAWNAQYNAMSIDLSLRHDNNEQFDSFNTGSIGVSRLLNNSIQANITYGTAFKAPTFNELYYPYYGSETLVPEESDTTELSFSGKYTAGSWSISLYQTNINNLIAYDSSTSMAGNINKAKITGAEIITKSRVSDWNIDTALSYTNPLDKSAANYNKVLQARAKQTLSIQISRHLGKYKIQSSILAQGKRYINSDNSKSVAGYGLINASLGYKVSKQIDISVKLNNILDKDYIINQGFGSTYNTLGRNIFINLKYHM